MWTIKGVTHKTSFYRFMINIEKQILSSFRWFLDDLLMLNVGAFFIKIHGVLEQDMFLINRAHLIKLCNCVVWFMKLTATSDKVYTLKESHQLQWRLNCLYRISLTAIGENHCRVPHGGSVDHLFFNTSLLLIVIHSTVRH